MTQNKVSVVLQQLSGPIRYRLTNAYMFVAVLQKDYEALCHLIAALLFLKRSDIVSVEVLNPVVLGEAIDSKDCILDLLVLLNENIQINLEMQIEDEGNWGDRSVYYLARKMSSLVTGENYNALKPMIQIGILDFNYPEDNQEFYQRYVLMNRKTHRIYSDKMQLNVLSLSQIENATEEDRKSGLYKWAKIFKATTWEELKALAENSTVINNTIVTIAQLSEDEKIRQLCERQEMAELDRRSAMDFAKKRGLAMGLEQGLAEGRELEIIRQVCKKLTRGKSTEVIADELEQDISFVSKICEAAKPFAPDYDVERIYRALSSIDKKRQPET